MSYTHFQGNGPQQLDKIQWIPFLNNSGEAIPRHAVLRITGFDVSDPELPKCLVAKPDDYGSQFSHAINDQYEIKPGEIGECCLGAMVPALYDSADGTPAFGEFWGPVDGSWKLRKGSVGFQVLGVVDSARKLVLVNPAPGLSFFGQPTEFAVWEGGAGGGSGMLVTFNPAYSTGGFDSLLATDFETQVWLRRGAVIPFRWYELAFIAPGYTGDPEYVGLYEVRNPELSLICSADADYDVGDTGSCTLASYPGSVVEEVQFPAFPVSSGAIVKVDWIESGWYGAGPCAN